MIEIEDEGMVEMEPVYETVCGGEPRLLGYRPKGTKDGYYETVCGGEPRWTSDAIIGGGNHIGGFWG